MEKGLGKGTYILMGYSLPEVSQGQEYGISVLMWPFRVVLMSYHFSTHQFQLPVWPKTISENLFSDIGESKPYFNICTSWQTGH